MQKQQECIYDHFQPDDRITFSVFLADALRSRPQLKVSYEGPVAGHELTHTDEWHDPRNPTSHALGRQLQQSVTKHWPTIKDMDKLQRNPNERLGVLNTQFTVDWTHAGEEEDAAAARSRIQQQNHKNHQSWAKQIQDHEQLEAEGKVDMREAPSLPVSTVPMAEVKAFEQTMQLSAEGWYRLCVNGVDSTPVLVEIDMRSMNNFRGIDRDTGHVYTYAKRKMLDEAALLEDESPESEGAEDHNTYASSTEEQAKIIENQIRENDLKQSKNYMRELMELTSTMSQQQQAHMARIRSHAGSAQRNHENLVWSSKVETLLYAIIMGFQVYTLRRWLLGNSMLGR